MLECVANLSEGRRRDVLARLTECAATDLLDVHVDPDHHRSVFTMVGEQSARSLTATAVALLDLASHRGVHPRLGVVDVVPFVPLIGSTMDDALAARQRFATWAARELGVPCFYYGPERSLPEVRRRAWVDLGPDVGPDRPHHTAGAICVGARDELVAYNVYLRSHDLDQARRVAAAVRGPHLRALGLVMHDGVQVSMNLVAPRTLGPAEAYDAVARLAEVERAELVGLVPAAVLDAISPERWSTLDLTREQTVEWRLARWRARAEQQ